MNELNSVAVSLLLPYAGPLQRLLQSPPGFSLRRLQHRVNGPLCFGLPPPDRPVDLLPHLLFPSPRLPTVLAFFFPPILGDEPVDAEICEPQAHHHVVVGFNALAVEFGDEIR